MSKRVRRGLRRMHLLELVPPRRCACKIEEGSWLDVEGAGIRSTYVRQQLPSNQ